LGKKQGDAVKPAKLFFVIFCLCLSTLFIDAQPATEDAAVELPLRRIALFSSGIAYVEHAGPVGQGSGSEIRLTFDADALNDVLQSLTVNDPSSASPSVRYAAENSLWRTLRSFRIDLSGMPGLGEILNGLRGEELEVSIPNPVRGRIVAVEYRPQGTEAWLVLAASHGIQTIAVSSIVSFRFIDERLNLDLHRSLDTIMASQNDDSRTLLLSLDTPEGSAGSRTVLVSYVLPAPVWKVSYRLDLSGTAPFLQAWAIVDNDSNTDWDNVELSLVIGRPVSFIQNLYAPFRLSRPVLPLSIAGLAEGRTHEAGDAEFAKQNDSLSSMAFSAPQGVPAPASAMQRSVMERQDSPRTLVRSTAENAEAKASGDQFLFTFKNPITLAQRQSTMLPLVQGNVRAERTLLFSGVRSSNGATIHPELAAELTNTSGMRLPAGPITVYDAGIFAGNALIEFFPENEKRFITFGEDMSVTGNVLPSTLRVVSTVSIANGIMTINRRLIHEKVYRIRNASDDPKTIVIEHPITAGAELSVPESSSERTAGLYRFSRNLPARDILSFTVREETPLSERITLGTLQSDILLSYASNQEIPEQVRAVLTQAIELKRAADEAASIQNQLEVRHSRLIAEQDRVRSNVQTVGSDNPQGQEFLLRLIALDGDIDAVSAEIIEAEREVERTRRAYEDYVSVIRI